MPSALNAAFNRLPRFIWGEAVLDTEESGFDPYDYLTHTRYPRFIADVAQSELMADEESRLAENRDADAEIDDDGTYWYVSYTHGVAIRVIVWLDRPYPPAIEEFKKVGDAALIDWLKRDDYLGLNND